jgi:hypothetical protein
MLTLKITIRRKRSMKKIFIALLVSAALAFCVGSAQANVPGVPDLSPGSDFVCYFLVSKARVDTGTGPTTLYNISETKGRATSASNPNTNLHFMFYTINSGYVHDRNVPITHWGTIMRDIAIYIIDMSDVERAALLVTFEGQYYYAGYIVMDNLASPAENIILQVYQVDLARGLAAASNVPVRTDFSSLATGANLAITGSALGGNELWSPNALAAAQQLVLGGAVADATWFAMYPKYYVVDSNGKSYWIFWRSNLWTGATPNTLAEYLTLHIFAINGAENYLSTTIRIRELSILNSMEIVPDGLKVSYPYIGMLNLTIPGSDGVPAMSDTYRALELLGWNWQMAASPAASLNWGVMNQIERDVGTTGTAAPQPAH